MKKIGYGLFILCLSLVGGCWDMREINDLGFVTAVGIDKAKPPNKYRVTVQVANASSATAKSEGGQTESGIWVGAEEGNSLFDAIRSLVRISSRRVMWAHNNVIIIGESLAKEGIIPVADFFTHNPELRMKTPVLVAHGDAKPCILAKAGMETPSGLSFTYFSDYGSLLAETVQSNMLTVSTDLTEKNEEALIAAVGLTKMEESAESGGGQSKGKSPKTIDLAGSAVFRRDKMVGWLSPEETRGAAWVLNQTKRTVVTVTDPSHHHQSVSVETDGVKAKVTAKVKQGMPRIVINISGGGSIVEEDCLTNESIHQLKKRMEKLVDRQIESEIKSCLKAIQKKYKCDVLNLAIYVHVQNDREWERRLKYQWKDIFPRVPIKVNVKIHIHSNMLKQEPMSVGG